MLLLPCINLLAATSQDVSCQNRVALLASLDTQRCPVVSPSQKPKVMAAEKL